MSQKELALIYELLDRLLVAYDDGNTVEEYYNNIMLPNLTTLTKISAWDM